VNQCPQRRPDSGGMALIAVLWLLALLTMLATAVAALSVSHRRAGEQLSHAVMLDALADSAIRVVILRIVSQNSPDLMPVAGRNLQIQLPQGLAEVVVSREAARLDINTADQDLLYAFFAANGWQEPDAERWPPELKTGRTQTIRRGSTALRHPTTRLRGFATDHVTPRSNLLTSCGR
jgi:hypothetical protein